MEEMRENVNGWNSYYMTPALCSASCAGASYEYASVEVLMNMYMMEFVLGIIAYKYFFYSRTRLLLLFYCRTIPIRSLVLT